MRRLINLKPGHGAAIVLAALPFILVIIAYLAGSAERLAANPEDKLLPAPHSLGEAIDRVAFKPDKRTGDVVLWTDTAASLGRLLAGVAISASLSLIIGIGVGLVPLLRATFETMIAALAMIPPLAVLPILFLVFGLTEVAKIALICICIAPFMTRDLILRVREIPEEEIVKAQTLGGSTWQIALRVVLPQIWPRLFDSIRLALGSAWLSLIAAEAIASESGLGYRIFLLRRFFAMDVILPYVAWITLLAFALDWSLRRMQHVLFPWFTAQRGAG